jgi:hypothetical protein
MLTDAKVRTAKPRPEACKIADANRLFLMITPSGGTLWRWNHEYDGKNETRVFFGATHSCRSQTLAKSDEAYAMPYEGRDPNSAKRLKIEANLEASRQTFERVAREWQGNAKAQWTKIHAAEVIRSLERGVFPSAGRMPITELTPPLLIRVSREIEARGAIKTAKHVWRCMAAIFIYGAAVQCLCHS